MVTAIAAMITIAALTLTYFSCVRPMLKSRGLCAPPGGTRDPEFSQEIAALREEVRGLRAQP